MESQLNYPELLDADFMGRFDVTMTYRLDSDVPVIYLEPDLIGALRNPPLEKTATAPIAYLGSSEFNQSGRHQYLEELVKHVPVHSFGRHMRNQKLSEDTGERTKVRTLTRYKFAIAFENSITPDYVTEKLFEPLVAGSVPIYLGAPNVDRFAPGERCFINAAEFFDPRELAEYILQLDRDPELYQTYLAWKQQPFRPSFQELIALISKTPFCRLCERLHSERTPAPTGADLPFGVVEEKTSNTRRGAAQAGSRRIAVVGPMAGLNISSTLGR